MSSEEDRKAFFAELEKRGEASVRASLDSNEWGNRGALVRLWLNDQELERREDADERAIEALEISRAAAQASERSAAAAERAALATEKAADYTRAAAWAAAIAAVVAFGTALLPLFH